MQTFEGKTAVITGAASGIGLALAEKAASERMNVVLADIEEDALERAVRHIEERQVRAIGVPVNTMLEESVQSVAERAIAEFGKVHLLFNNAGVASAATAGKPIWEVPDADWNWVMGVNFYGVLYGIRAFVPHMLEHGEPSHIVNTASLAAVMPGGGTYGVSKHAVLALTEGLQRDFAERGANINASVLCPGFVNTNIHKAERNRPREVETVRANPEIEEMGMALMQDMLSRGKAPSEVADIVFSSVSEHRFYILPHPSWDEFVRGRVEQILARGPVASMDMTEMQRRREEGEVF
ncbi:MAG: SDR family NAD(P)-dependent oxidoreductase [Pseudomonadales bacterium]|jgi:NAD(P)-dependent dehydrogenase (short-subunit alcohol dehydrogenase family)